MSEIIWKGKAMIDFFIGLSVRSRGNKMTNSEKIIKRTSFKVFSLFLHNIFPNTDMNIDL
jgi:hypothetical protein